jgi:hypothetical protein
MIVALQKSSCRIMTFVHSGSPMFTSRQSVFSAALLTGPCLYLASCRSHCSCTRVVAGYMSLPREVLNVKDSRVPLTLSAVSVLLRAARCRFTNPPFSLCLFPIGTKYTLCGPIYTSQSSRILLISAIQSVIQHWYTIST